MAGGGRGVSARSHAAALFSVPAMVRMNGVENSIVDSREDGQGRGLGVIRFWGIYIYAAAVKAAAAAGGTVPYNTRRTKEGRNEEE